MSNPDLAPALTIRELAVVTGGAAADPYAKVGTPGRCAYVETHLKKLGTPAAALRSGAVPVISRGASTFGAKDLAQRLKLEHFFHCRTK